MKLINKVMLWGAALCFFVPKTSAQLDKLNYRAEIGISHSRISNFGTGTSFLGFRASGQILFPFKYSKFALVSGLTLTNKGETDQTFFKKTRPQDNLKEVYYTRLMYLQVPLDISLHLDLHPDHKVYLATGPYFAIGLTGTTTTNGKTILKLYDKDGDGGQTPFKRTEFGWGANLVYAFKNIYLKTGLELSLTDVMNPTPTVKSHLGDGSRRHGVAYLTLGYQF